MSDRQKADLVALIFVVIFLAAWWWLPSVWPVLVSLALATTTGRAAFLARRFHDE
jgi:hypothetical protein